RAGPWRVAVEAQLLAQVERRPAGALRVILVRDRRAEERHDAVAGELVHRPLEAVHARSEDGEETIDDPVPLLGIELLGQLHRALHVGEKHRDLLALALEHAAGAEDLLGQVGWGVGAGIAPDLVRERRRENMPARRAELDCRADDVAAARATPGQRRPTLLAELRGRAVLVLAAGAPHGKGPGIHALPQLLEERRLRRLPRHAFAFDRHFSTASFLRVPGDVPVDKV